MLPGGDDKGNVRRRLVADLQGFSAYFHDAFFPAMEGAFSPVEGVELRLPDRDSAVALPSSVGSSELQKMRTELGVNAVLAVSLVLYDEVTPAGTGARGAGAILDTLLVGSRYKGADEPVAEFVVYCSYLGVEDVKDPVTFHFIGKPLPTTEEQRKYFVDELVKYIKVGCPLSTHCRRGNGQHHRAGRFAAATGN